LNTGLVIKSTGSWYNVISDETGENISCQIRGKLRTKGIKTTNPIAVGDRVEYKCDTNVTQGIIHKILPRKNYIIRKSINLSKQAHILAANVDQAVLIVTLANPKTYPEFIDRFLVSAEAYRIPTRIVFNKIDIYSQELIAEMEYLISVYESIGYECYRTSAKVGTGLDTIAKLLSNKISVIAGHSGIGKSTLINTIEPKLDLKTNEISEYHEQGKHTTTFPEMFKLTGGGYIIDTPGIRGFGIIDIDKEELYHFFPEIFAISNQCKFYNCTHIHEPQCAVKEAFENGKISDTRYKSYINLFFDEENEKYRTVDY